MGKIEQLQNVVIDTGRKMYRDKSINSGTKFLIDMSSTWAGAAKKMNVDEPVKELTFGSGLGTFNKEKNYLSGGMVYAGVSGDVFRMPENSAPKVSDKHWIFTAWFKFTSPGSNGFNNQMFSIAGGALNVTTYQMIAAVPTVSSGVVTQVEFKVRGRNFVVSGSSIGTLYDGKVHQLSIELELSADGTTQKVTVYLDKVPVYTSPSTAVLADTSALTNTSRNIGTSGSFPITWAGSFYRARLDDLTATDLTAVEILESDYSSSLSRFS